MLIVVILIASLVLLFLVKRPWVVRVIQTILVLGAIEWVLTLSELMSRRIEMGQPYMRLVAIIGSVAFLTAVSGLVFRSESLRNRYGMNVADTSAEEQT
jgi:asparagine N-glycosylation enzyme membrane subunit Stt3